MYHSLRKRLALIAGILLTAIYAWQTGWPAPIQATDANQHRVDTALPLPEPGLGSRQTFIPARDGLSQIELLLVQYGGQDPVPAGAESGDFRLTLLNETGDAMAEQSWPSRSLQHNQPLLFQFEPQPEATGQTYTLELSGSAGNTVTAWGYSLDVLDDGKLTMDAPSNPTPADLRFITRYTLTTSAALVQLARQLGSEAGFLLLALAYILLPGMLLIILLPVRAEFWTRAGIVLALGVALWPLLWQWLALTGWRWRSWNLWLLLAVGWGFILWRFAHRWRRQPAAERHWLRRIQPHLPMLFLLALVLATRLLAVRDLAFPPWVDAGRHALITTLMVEEGQPLASYRPLLPVDRFPYHYGFHTLSAGLTIMTGRELPALLLTLGQLLNALVPLAIYSAAYLLTRRRLAGFIAAFLVALPFFFPGYYATWSRYTQLSGMIILPVLAALTWRLVHFGRISHPASKRGGLLVGLLAAGLFLVHFRVFLLYLPWAIIVLLTTIHTWPIQQLRLKNLMTLARPGVPPRPPVPSTSNSKQQKTFHSFFHAGILGAILILPRAVQLLQSAPADQLLSAPGSYHQPPLDYIRLGWESVFLWLGLALTMLAIIAALRRKPGALLPLSLAAWVGLATLLLWGVLPLPQTWLINLNSAYITLFLPLSLLIALAAARLWEWVQEHRWLWLQPLAWLCAGALLAAAALFGTRQQVDIINPSTILGRPPDMAGIAWAGDNLPPDALVAVNSWRWLGGTWAGADGGAWLLPLTGLQTTTPPADYYYDADLYRDVDAFNQAALEIEDWTAPAAADWLREQEVTHIFVGNNGGIFDPARLEQNPAIQRLYASDGVFIYVLDGE